MKQYNIAQTFNLKIIASLLLIGKEKDPCIFAYFINTKRKRVSVCCLERKKIFYNIYISLNTCVLNTHKVNEFIYSGK